MVCWLVAACSTLALVSPIDLLPEALLGPFGLIDDLVYGPLAAVSAYFGFRPRQPKAQKSAPILTDRKES